MPASPLCSTILLDAEDAVEGQPHRASVSISAAPGESKDKEFKHDAAHMQEGKRKAALPLFQQLKNALILEAQLIKKDLSEVTTTSYLLSYVTHNPSSFQRRQTSAWSGRRCSMS